MFGRRLLDVVLTRMAHEMGADDSVYVIRDCSGATDLIGLTTGLDPSVPILIHGPSPGDYRGELGLVRELVEQARKQRG